MSERQADGDGEVVLGAQVHNHLLGARPAGGLTAEEFADDHAGDLVQDAAVPEVGQGLVQMLDRFERVLPGEDRTLPLGFPHGAEQAAQGGQASGDQRPLRGSGAGPPQRGVDPGGVRLAGEHGREVIAGRCGGVVGAEVPQDSGPVEGRHAGPGGDRVQQHRRVAHPYDRLRVGADQRVVQAAQEPVGGLATPGAHHGRDVGVGDEGVEVVQESGLAAGPVAVGVQRVGGGDRLEPAAAQSDKPAFELVGALGRFGRGHGDDADAVALGERGGQNTCGTQARSPLAGAGRRAPDRPRGDDSGAQRDGKGCQRAGASRIWVASRARAAVASVVQGVREV